MQRNPREKNKAHCDFIRSLPCIACGDNTSTEAAHLRVSYLRAAKRQVGKGEKPDDKWTLPLCGACHRQQHETGELVFWHRHGIDAIFTALALWGATGNHEAGEQIVRLAR